MTLLPYPYTLTAALALASVYVFGHSLRPSSHHRGWVSIAAGVSVAVVFMDFLPEISESQAKFLAVPHGDAAIFPAQAIYITAMFGFMLFYGFEYMIAASVGEKPGRGFFSLRIAAFAGYSILIAYLLVHNIWNNARSLLLYSLAMAFHLLIVDHSLARQRDELYESRGRWILAFAIMAGWLIGILTSIPDQWLARITGFISGGVIMNSLVVELPEGRGGRFWPFATAAAAYSLVLLVVLGLQSSQE
jgi:hypothetical protein